jgi:hypothetical protein
MTGSMWLKELLVISEQGLCQDLEAATLNNDTTTTLKAIFP